MGLPNNEAIGPGKDFAMMGTRKKAFILSLSLILGLAWAATVVAKGNESTKARFGTAAGALATESPRTASDALPPAARPLAVSERPDGTSNELFEGAWLIGESKQLVPAKGSRHASFYVVPTTRGWLCQVVTVDPAGEESVSAAGGCITDFSPSTPIGLNILDSDAVDSGEPVIVAGVLPKDVTAISVIVGGRGHAASIENGAYLYELVDPTEFPDAIQIRYNDGRNRTVDLPDPRPAINHCAQGEC
jgi:hypothetical protein